jgi:hypothetical protein
VRAGAFFIELSRLLAVAGQHPGAAFPVTLSRQAAVRQGVATLLVVCPAGADGDLVALTIVHHVRRQIAHHALHCVSPSGVLRLAITALGQRRLRRAGHLAVLVRITAGARHRTVVLVLRPAKGPA